MTIEERQTALARSLCARICDERRSFDELRVLDRVLIGIERGAEDYGPLDLARDTRLWNREAEQECRDLLFYLAAQYVAEQAIRRERIECEIADEIDPVERGLTELRRNTSERDE